METIVFDCDGVLCDFAGKFYEYYKEKGYIEQYGMISRYPKTWNFDFQGDKKLFTNIIIEFISSKPLLPLVDSSIPDILKRLYQSFNLYIVSHYHDVEGRRQNLERLGIRKGEHYKELYCVDTRAKKIKTIQELKPKYYVEDSPEVIDVVSLDNFEKTILVPTQYEYCNNFKPHPSIKRYDHPLEWLDHILA